MDWDKLRIFHMVAKAGSFTHAGDTLNLSQSAISRHVSAFEEDLGITLFHRHARGLVLTEQGELLFNASTDIFSKMMAIEGQLSDARNLTAGELTVTLPEFLGTFWLASKIGEFHRTHTDICLSLLMDDRIFNLGLREADVAIRLYKPEQPDLIGRKLTSMAMAICASTEYLNQYGTPQTIGDLANHTIVAYPEQAIVPYANPNWLLEQAKIKITKNNNLILLNSVSTIYQSIINGAGVGVIPQFMLRNNPSLVHILPDIKPPSIDMYFVYSDDRRHSKRITVFRDFLIDQINKTGF